MKNKTDGLCGVWETEARDSRMRIEVSFRAGKPKVVAFDKEDGERFRVSKCAWDGEWLSFETYVPSMRYRTRTRMKRLPNGRLKQELTLVENWARVQGE